MFSQNVLSEVFDSVLNTSLIGIIAEIKSFSKKYKPDATEIFDKVSPCLFIEQAMIRYNFENTLSVITLFMWFSETQNTNNFKNILLVKMNSGQKY